MAADDRSLDGVTVDGRLVGRAPPRDGERIGLGRVEPGFLVGRPARLP